IRRMRRRLPSATILACLWGYDARSVPQSELTGANGHALTLADVVDLCRNAVKPADAGSEALEVIDAA
ncbi:MAG TPA: hypothetical protein VGF60_23620, partial [Xanthobacteraceae bacterium]